jgi:hypothetical protein
MGDLRQHTRDRRPAPRAMPYVVELTRQIAGRAPCERRYVAYASQIRSMARSARGRAVAGRDELLAARDAAFRHVGREVRVRIAQLPLPRITRHFHDACAERLAAGTRNLRVEADTAYS